MLSDVWGLVKFGLGFYLFIGFFVVLWFVFNDKFPHLIYIATVGCVTIGMFLVATFAQRIIMLIPFVILVVIKFIIPKVFKCYKIYALKTMNRVINNYTKQYGFTSPQKFGDRYLAVKYKYRYAFFEYSGSIIKEYYPPQLKDSVPNEASYVNIIGANYLCAGVKYYRKCIICHILQIDNISERSMLNSNPKNFTYSEIVKNLKSSGFDDFILHRDGSIAYDLQRVVIDSMLEKWETDGILKKYDTKRGDTAYCFVGLSSNRISQMNIDHETFNID